MFNGLEYVKWFFHKQEKIEKNRKVTGENEHGATGSSRTKQEIGREALRFARPHGGQCHIFQEERKLGRALGLSGGISKVIKNT